MTTEKKPLATRKEIDAAYPEHAKLREAHERKKGAAAMLQWLLSQHLEEAANAVEVIQDYLAADEIDEPTETGRAMDALVQLKHNVRKWQQDNRSPLFASLGIDEKAFWREKDDMLDQLRAAQEDAAP